MSKTEILTVIEGEEYIFYTEYSSSMNQGSPTSRQIEGSEPLGEYIGFSEFNSIIDSSRQDDACLAGEQGSSPRGHNDMDKEEAPN